MPTNLFKTHESPSVVAGVRSGGPATSATVKFLLSVVGMSYANRRKRAHAGMVEDLAFTQLNL